MNIPIFSEEEIEEMLNEEVAIPLLDVIAENLYKWHTCTQKRKLFVIDKSLKIIDPYTTLDWKEKINEEISKEKKASYSKSKENYFFSVEEIDSSYIEIIIFDSKRNFFQELHINVKDYNTFIIDILLKVYKYKNYTTQQEKMQLINNLHPYIKINAFLSKNAFINYIINYYKFEEFKHLYF